MAGYSHSELFQILYPFLLSFGFNDFCEMVMNNEEIDETVWLLQWLTSDLELPIGNEDLTRFVKALNLIGPDVMGLIDDNQSVESLSNFSDTDEEEDEGLKLGLPRGLYRTLLPLPKSVPDNSFIDSQEILPLPFGIVNGPSIFQNSIQNVTREVQDDIQSDSETIN